MSKEFKPNTPVLARIAEVFSQSNAIKKTHLHFASRTDWNSFEKYMHWLQTKNYIQYMVDGKDHKYQLTDDGKEMISIVLKLRDHVMKYKSIISI